MSSALEKVRAAAAASKRSFIRGSTGQFCRRTYMFRRLSLPQTYLASPSSNTQDNCDMGMDDGGNDGGGEDDFHNPAPKSESESEDESEDESESDEDVAKNSESDEESGDEAELPPVGVKQLLSESALTGKNSKLNSSLSKRIMDIVYPKIEVLESTTDHSFVKTILKRINNFIPKEKPKNSNALFDVNNSRPDAFSVKDFAIGLNDLVATHGLTKVCVNDLLTLLRDSTESIALPLLEKDLLVGKDGTKRSPADMRDITSNIITDYVGADTRDITSDVCRKECMVFRGFRKVAGSAVPVDCSKLIRCLVCKSPRFTKCGHVTCRTNSRPYDFCNPFDGVIDPDTNKLQKRGHSLAQRIAMKRVYYRTIIGKLIQMYCLSLMEGFEDILSYNKTRIKRKGKIIDILDGKKVQLQAARMRQKFLEVKKDWDENYSDLDLHECSILLTMSYDGVTNFKRNSDSMWPMLCSIANCNPSNRGKIGAGMFLVMLHNASVGSGVETYMMKEMLTAELKKLEQGLFFTIPAQDGFAERHVFLQARLLYAHLDTKALEKVACIKLSNSLMGCNLCNLQIGVYRHSVRKCVYHGTRLPLHQYHILRRCGQRRFKRDPVRKRVNGDILKEARNSAEENERLYYSGDPKSTDKIKQECSAVHLNDTLTKLPENFSNPLRFCPKKPAEKYIVWSHKDPRFQFPSFAPALRYAYPDGRKSRKHKRESTEIYKVNGNIAKKRKLDDDAIFAATGKRSKKDYSYNGVHDVSPLVEDLSFKYENFSPDVMHYVSNFSNYQIKLQKGVRGLTDGSRVNSVSQEKHPELMYKKVKVNWTVDKAEQDLIDLVVNSMLLPPAYRSTYGIRHPFKLRSHLRAKDHMVFIMAYASYALSFSNIGESYKTFTAMYAADLCKIFNPILDLEELYNEIIPEVYETRSVQEGIFPESEQVFVLHQIVDIVHQLMNFGHVRGVSSFAAERANGSITQCLSKGGVHYMDTLQRRYIIKENMMTKHLRFRDEDDYDNCGNYSDFTLKLYTQQRDNMSQLKEQQLNYLFRTVYMFLRTQEDDNILQGSPFYRLYTAYQFMRMNNGMYTDNTSAGLGRFYTWLMKFYSAYLKSFDSQVDSITKQTDINSNTNNNNIKSSKNTTNRKKSRQCTTLLHRVTDTNIDSLLVLQGHVYEKDLVEVVNCITYKTNHIQVYDRATIKGVKFRCRGFKYGTSNEDIDRSQNDLVKGWCVRLQYSSWCTIKDYVADKDDISISTEIKFGQLNYCFRLNFPVDKYIHGLAIGHCSLRKCELSAKRWQYSVVATGSVTDKFICLNYVDSSAIAVSAVDANDVPVISSDNLTSFTSKSAGTDNYLPVSRLFLIPIHPERLTLTYGCIVPDQDNTRALEPDCYFKNEPVRFI